MRVRTLLGLVIVVGCTHPTPPPRDQLGPNPGQSTAPLPADPSVPPPDSAGTLPPGDLDTTPHPKSSERDRLGAAHVRVSAAPTTPSDGGVPMPVADAGGPQPDGGTQPSPQKPLPAPGDAAPPVLPDGRMQPMH